MQHSQIQRPRPAPRARIDRSARLQQHPEHADIPRVRSVMQQPHPAVHGERVRRPLQERRITRAPVRGPRHQLRGHVRARAGRDERGDDPRVRVRRRTRCLQRRVQDVVSRGEGGTGGQEVRDDNREVSAAQGVCGAVVGSPWGEEVRWADGAVQRGVAVRRGVVDVCAVEKEECDDRGAAEVDGVVERVVRGCVVRVRAAFQDALDDGGGAAGAEVLQGRVVPEKAVFEDDLRARVGGSEHGEEVREGGGCEEQGKHAARGQVRRDVDGQLGGERGEREDARGNERGRKPALARNTAHRGFFWIVDEVVVDVTRYDGRVRVSLLIRVWN